MNAYISFFSSSFLCRAGPGWTTGMSFFSEIISNITFHATINLRVKYLMCAAFVTHILIFHAWISACTEFAWNCDRSLNPAIQNNSFGCSGSLNENDTKDTSIDMHYVYLLPTSHWSVNVFYFFIFHSVGLLCAALRVCVCVRGCDVGTRLVFYLYEQYNPSVVPESRRFPTFIFIK